VGVPQGDGLQVHDQAVRSQLVKRKTIDRGGIFLFFPSPFIFLFADSERSIKREMKKLGSLPTASCDEMNTYSIGRRERVCRVWL